MVEVLKSNFKEMLPSIQQSIRNASFIAIDTEFTGLELTQDSKPSLFDSLEDRYKKLKDSASNFVICQLGLTIFTKKKNENIFSAETFVFYLRPHQCGYVDRRFSFQASSIDFLNAYDFDFNKYLNEGLPYLNEVEISQVKKELADGTFYLPHLRNVGENTRRCDQINEWLNKAEINDEMTLPLETVGHQYFQSYAIRLKFPCVWTYVQDNKVVVKKVSLEMRERLLMEFSKEEEESLLDFYIGFSHVFKTLKESKKVIIGHNLLMDLFLIYHSFYKYLPDSFSEFKKNLLELFPSIYDTKHMWLNVRKFYDVGRINRKSALYELFAMLQNPSDNLSTLFCPFVEHLNSGDYESNALLHNAGYDSFLAGWVFLRISHILAIKRTKNIAQVVPQSLKQLFTAVKPFENKVNISMARVFYVDLTEKYVVLHRPHFLRVTMKDDKQSLNILEVEQRLRSYGHLEMKQIGRTEALVAVGSFACAEDMLATLSNDQVLRLERYSLFKHWLPAKIALMSVCLASSTISLFLIYKFARLHR